MKFVVLSGSVTPGMYLAFRAYINMRWLGEEPQRDMICGFFSRQSHRLMEQIRGCFGRYCPPRPPPGFHPLPED